VTGDPPVVPEFPFRILPGVPGVFRHPAEHTRMTVMRVHKGYITGRLRIDIIYDHYLFNIEAAKSRKHVPG
jgi:hypothetical protein